MERKVVMPSFSLVLLTVGGGGNEEGRCSRKEESN